MTCINCLYGCCTSNYSYETYCCYSVWASWWIYFVIVLSALICIACITGLIACCYRSHRRALLTHGTIISLQQQPNTYYGINYLYLANGY
jgi:hypothetical protein